jgi:hypothetical protein
LQPSKAPLAAAAAALIFLSSQWFTVAAHYQGDWTALFCTGALRPVPPALEQSTYRFENATGYDGQFYRYISHDPFFQRGYTSYIDHPRLRYRRILVPWLAFVLGFGQKEWIDAAFFAVLAGSVALGGFWLALFAERNGRSPWWGVSFAGLSGVLISGNRMTIDVALLALCAGYALVAKRSDWKTYLALSLAVLARETGLLLLGAHCLHLLLERQVRRCLIFASAAMPAALWTWYVSQHAARTPAELADWNFTSVGGGFWHLLHLVLAGDETVAWRLLDLAALLSIVALLLAVAVPLVRCSEELWDLHLYAWLLLAVVLASLAAVQAVPYWQSVFSYGRSLSPLLLLHLVRYLQGGASWVLAPIVFLGLRVAIDIVLDTGVKNL